MSLPGICWNIILVGMTAIVSLGILMVIVIMIKKMIDILKG